MRFVAYSDDVEEIAPDEDETVARIIEVMGKGGKTTRERYGRSVRVWHAKAHGFVKGELRVANGLATELRRGLFATEHSVCVRPEHARPRYVSNEVAAGLPPCRQFQF